MKQSFGLLDGYLLSGSFLQYKHYFFVVKELPQRQEQAFCIKVIKIRSIGYKFPRLATQKIEIGSVGTYKNVPRYVQAVKYLDHIKEKHGSDL